MFPDIKPYGEQVLQPNVLTLMSTLDGLIFAINVNDLNISHLRTELSMMLTEKRTPLLILCCSCQNAPEGFDLRNFTKEMNLLENEGQMRPWGAFLVNVTTMSGMEKAISWLLHHLLLEGRNG